MDQTDAGLALGSHSKGLLRSLAGIAAALLFALPGTALAQRDPSTDVQRFVPAGGQGAFVGVETARQLSRLTPGLDVWVAYGHQPVLFSSGDLEKRRSIIDGQLTGHLRAGFGLTDWAEFDLILPFAQVSRIGNALEGFEEGTNAFSPGDVELQARLRLVPEEKGVGLALIPFFSVPTGRSELLQSSGVPTLGARLALSRHARFVHVAAHVGYTLKPGFSMLENYASDDELDFGVGVGITPWIEWLHINVEVNGSTVVGPSRAQAPITNAKGLIHTPMELLVHAGLELPRGFNLHFGGGPGLTPGVGTPQWRVFAGFGWAPDQDGGGGPGDKDGDRIPDDEDACPDVAEDYDEFEDDDGCPDEDNDRDGIKDIYDDCPMVPEDPDRFEDDDGCPDPDNDDDDVPDLADDCPLRPEDPDGFMDQNGCPDPDNDNDLVLDVDDSCPLDPEDRDRFEDEDGCPDLDNDGDKIPDVEDLCPNRPENVNGVKDEDGCPDDVLAVVKGDRILMLEKVMFVTNKDVIIEASFPILRAVTKTLLDSPEILRVRIEGHTDNRGSDSYNQRLSETRAQAIQRFLVQSGIAPERLEAVGFGEGRPIADNDTELGLQKNRRVEFVILERLAPVER